MVVTMSLAGTGVWNTLLVPMTSTPIEGRIAYGRLPRSKGVPTVATPRPGAVFAKPGRTPPGRGRLIGTSGALSGPSAGDSRAGEARVVTVGSPVTAGATGALSPVTAGVVPLAGGTICAATGEATSNATNR